MASSSDRVKTTMVEVPTLNSVGPLGASGAANGESARTTPKTLVEGMGNSDGVQSWRPLYRPTMAVVWFLDDDGSTAETVRLRGDRFVIGRDEGDFCLPHDSNISGRHAEIVREVRDGEFQWIVRDLESTNGTFAKVDEGLLKHEKEIILGSRRYRFESAPLGDTSASGDRSADRKGTQQWQVATVAKPEEFSPSLVELKPEGDGDRYVLSESNCQLGSDASLCSVLVEGDPFLSPTHCRFVQRENGDWYIEDLESKNGTWLRVKQVRVRKSSMVLMGEQRIIVRQM